MAKCKGCFCFLFACTCVAGPWALVFSHQPDQDWVTLYMNSIFFLYSEEQNKIILLPAIVLVLENNSFLFKWWHDRSAWAIPHATLPKYQSVSIHWMISQALAYLGVNFVSSLLIWDTWKERNQKAFTVSSGCRKRWLPKMLEEKNKEKKELKNNMGTSKDTCWIYSA